MTRTNVRYTLEQFHDLGDRGLFESRGAVLLDGIIIEEGRMTPAHATGILLAGDALRPIFGRDWWVSMQLPLVVGEASDPVPDVAVVRRGDRTATRHPTTAVLVIEVADDTLGFALGEKQAAYARGDIADYWVLDVNGRQLHIFRGPAGDVYATHLTLGEADTVSPLAAPAAIVRVADLLP
ncbi:Uma2 family endonuclease [bacterium]|nr:Uma2 family endonuclease [bacterium]